MNAKTFDVAVMGVGARYEGIEVCRRVTDRATGRARPTHRAAEVGLGIR
jgi:hypothetical protein